jgi:hypothetical protein
MKILSFGHQEKASVAKRNSKEEIFGSQQKNMEVEIENTEILYRMASR